MPFPPVHPKLLRALTERQFAEPTPVQASVLDPNHAGHDLLVSAQTGSGKTVAYGLTLGATLLGDAEKFEPSRRPLALIVAPTRELALQVQRELEWLYKYTGCRFASCVGGMDIRRERRMLDAGAHIVVGTPGRLCDHMERGSFNASELRAVVLDEADEMLDMGFREDLERILEATPETRRTLLFSATIPKAIATIARRYQRDAVRLATSPEREAHGDIEYRVFHIAPQDRDHAVVNALRYFEVRGALVFCRTREGVKHLHGNLLERGFAVVALSGELSQAERNRALQTLRDGRARVCVATDVAARGLDLPDLGLVIHADLPNDREMLVHRSGRTGRAGRKGICVLVVAHPARRLAQQLLAAANIDARWEPPPSVEAIRAHDQERLVRDIAAAAGELSDEDLAAARALLEHSTPEQLAALLVRREREQLPAPEELTRLATVRPPPAGQDARARRAEQGNTVWFVLNIGRSGNADPRWLIPFLCKRGHITKSDIGKIRIGAHETGFEISESVAARFSAAARRPDAMERDIQIRPMEPSAPPARHTADRPPPKRPRKPFGDHNRKTH